MISSSIFSIIHFMFLMGCSAETIQKYDVPTNFEYLIEIAETLIQQDN